MRALTIWQPYAAMICLPGYDVPDEAFRGVLACD